MLGIKDNEFVTLKDVPANDFMAAYADFLKRTNKIELPKWVDLVKTGHYHELTPYVCDEEDYEKYLKKRLLKVTNKISNQTKTNLTSKFEIFNNTTPYKLIFQ